MINGFYYNEQFKKFIVQFSAIFAGLQVQTGQQADGTIHTINVPVRYGSIDRVVAWIKNGFTQNKMLTLPTMSTYLLDVELAPERRKGVGITQKKVMLPTGGVFPTDLTTVERYMPIPYDLTFELAVYASNSDQMFQILEQIMILFDPILEIQLNDSPFDWAKDVVVELMSIQSEENYPVGTERRIIVWNLNFVMRAWLSPPAALRDELVRQVNIRFGNLDGFTLEGYDSNGEFDPYANPLDNWGTVTADESSVTLTS